MGHERDARYYDAIYRSSSDYRLAPDDAPWAPLWRWCAARVQPHDTVIDLGCGPGHFARIVRCASYTGIDFSRIAIHSARQRTRRTGFSFIVGTLPDALRPRCGSVVVACEFLEHVEHDLECLALVTPGTRMLGTVPRNDDPSHVRTFPDRASVLQRYGEHLEVTECQEIGDHIAFAGRRR